MKNDKIHPANPAASILEGSIAPPPATEKKQEVNIVDVITTNANVNTLIALIERIDFRLVNLMIQNTPDNLKTTANYLTLVATLEYFKDLAEIFQEVDAAESENKENTEKSVIIKPNF